MWWLTLIIHKSMKQMLRLFEIEIDRYSHSGSYNPHSCWKSSPTRGTFLHIHMRYNYSHSVDSFQEVHPQILEIFFSPVKYVINSKNMVIFKPLNFLDHKNQRARRSWTELGITKKVISLFESHPRGEVLDQLEQNI